MYAVLKTGGKQYRVSPGDIIKVERLHEEAGNSVSLSDILMVDNEGEISLGEPFIEDASITATILEEKRTRKIIVFKQKRRKGYRRKAGHRQHQTVLKIEEIKANGKSFKAEKTAEKKTASPKATEKASTDATTAKATATSAEATKNSNN